jgi:hypothetical protein
MIFFEILVDAFPIPFVIAANLSAWPMKGYGIFVAGGLRARPLSRQDGRHCCSLYFLRDELQHPQSSSRPSEQREREPGTISPVIISWRLI